jgi:NAD(P)H-dependent FMN reductase
MNSTKNILAISGSTREKSTNLNLLHAIADLAADRFALTIFESLAALPHFNPDLDHENPPEKVADFRRMLRQADGIMICTPEYAMGVPGTLKNAIDWTVSSCEFSHKPVALITASTLGEKGHEALLHTLRIIESNMTDKTQLLISHIRTKVNAQGEITDPETKEHVEELVEALYQLTESA